MESRLDIGRYQRAREKGNVEFVRVGESYHMLIKRFCPESGGTLKPEEHAVTPQHVEDLRAQAKRLTEVADYLETDMQAADRAAMKRGE
jgi:hypothetical protein